MYFHSLPFNTPPTNTLLHTASVNAWTSVIKGFERISIRMSVLYMWLHQNAILIWLTDNRSLRAVHVAGKYTVSYRIKSSRRMTQTKSKQTNMLSYGGFVCVSLGVQRLMTVSKRKNSLSLLVCVWESDFICTEYVNADESIISRKDCMLVARSLTVAS